MQIALPEYLLMFCIHKCFCRCCTTSRSLLW